ncbi:UNVERIFIED_CONTAM: hypothetical protein GTU68_026400 [Idotea baltica]|nr:hypothetical protein [Idotea baltica]
MIIVKSVVSVIDNSGAKMAQCIKILGSSRKKVGKVGSIIKVSIKEIYSTGKIKKGTVYNAIIIRTKCATKRSTGVFFKFNDNCVVLLDHNRQVIGTRVAGIIPREIQKCGISKLFSFAKKTI